MYERLRACAATTKLPIDLEANHRLSKHPSRNITLKPFKGFTGKCFVTVIFSYVGHFTNAALKAR